MVQNIQDLGEEGSEMDMASWFGMMDLDMKVNGHLERLLILVNLYILTTKNSMEDGEMTN